MLRVESETTINRSPDEVFERLTDISGYSKWMPKTGVFTRSEQISTGPVGKGTEYVDKGRMGTWKGVVSDFDRPTSVAYRETVRWLGLQVMEARPRYTLEKTDGGTRLHHVAEGQLYGVFKLMHPMVAVIAHGERKRTVDALKRSLEPSQTSSR